MWGVCCVHYGRDTKVDTWVLSHAVCMHMFEIDGKIRVRSVYCLHRPSVTVDLIDCKRNPNCKKKLKSNRYPQDLISTPSSPISHSATRLKKMKTSKISTQFSGQFVALDKFLRKYILLVFSLDAVVGLASDNLLKVCTSDFSMRLLHDSQLELPSVQCLLDHSIADSNLICLDRARLSSTYKCDLLELIRPFLYT